MPPHSTSSSNQEASKLYASGSGTRKERRKKQSSLMEDKTVTPQSLGSEMSYFYLPDRLYDESDQQDYMTGEENGSEEEEEEVITPRLKNHSKGSERVRRNVSFHDISSQESAREGVTLDPMMGSLLGVSFIPFDTRLTKEFRSHDSEILLSSDEEEDEEDDDDDDESDEEAAFKEESPEGDRNNRKRRKKKGKKNGKRRGLRKLRRQLNERPRKEKRERKKHWKRTKAKAKHRHLTNSLSNNISSEMDRIEIGRKRLQIVKNSLRCADNEVKKVIGEAERSSNRVSKLTKTITELECKLDMSLRALEQERATMQSNMTALTNLNSSRDLLERETLEIQTDLRLQIDQLDGESAISFDSSVDIQDYSGQSGRRNRSRSNTGGTDISFATAYEQYGASRSRSYTGDSISIDSSYGEPIDMKVPATKMSRPSSPKKTLKKSSFLRIQDLEIPHTAGSEVREMLNCCARDDLCSLDHDASHVVLEALVQHALAQATDESSRWSPDGPSQKAISKRPTTEHHWHYTGPDEIFVWHGKLENAGYKSDLPVIKARGMIQTSPRNLAELLLDSSKVKLYNKMSLGREDRHFIKKGLDTKGNKLYGEAKLMRSVSSVPVMRKKLELVSLLYAKPLDEEKDGMKGYICVNRSIWEDENKPPTDSDDGGSGSSSDENFIRCECLLGVNFIRELDGDHAGFSELTTINHFFTPGAPTFGARQFGMKAAGNFIREIQNQFK